MSTSAVEAAVAAGESALARGAWSVARERFEAALQHGDDAGAWEGLGWTGWWLHDAELTMRAREAAYRAHRDAGDAAGAARAAMWLAADHREYRGDEPAGRGWLARARRLLDGLEGESAEHGWLALHEGSFALSTGDVREVVLQATAAVAVGRRLGDADLEAVGLAQEGLALVLQGDVVDGMQRLDEASAAVHGEPLAMPVSPGWTLCYLVAACEGVGDFPRAASWCAAMRELAQRWHGRQLLGVCRTTYGRLLVTRGEWSAAESELSAAVGDLIASRPGVAGSGYVRLAELRARQGRLDEARELYEQAGAHPDALVGLGELALDDGDPVAACDAAERVLRRLPDEIALERLPALELLARARAADADPDGAAAASRTVRAVADAFGTPYLRGRAERVAAEVALAAGAADAARRAAEDAVDCFTAADAPYEAATARLLLAAALARLGRPRHAADERATARQAFARLGAVRDERRAATADGGAAELTARELEVLRLVAEGCSDAEIADRLVVSPHTVHRHVANIRAKLRLPSRAAAVAYASRAGVL